MDEYMPEYGYINANPKDGGQWQKQQKQQQQQQQNKQKHHRKTIKQIKTTHKTKNVANGIPKRESQ